MPEAKVLACTSDLPRAVRVDQLDGILWTNKFLEGLVGVICILGRRAVGSDIFGAPVEHDKSSSVTVTGVIRLTTQNDVVSSDDIAKLLRSLFLDSLADAMPFVVLWNLSSVGRGLELGILANWAVGVLWFMRPKV